MPVELDCPLPKHFRRLIEAELAAYGRRRDGPAGRRRAERIAAGLALLGPEAAELVRRRYLGRSRSNHEQVMIRLRLDRSAYFRRRDRALATIAAGMGW
jgi:hypothetical protein